MKDTVENLSKTPKNVLKIEQTTFSDDVIASLSKLLLDHRSAWRCLHDGFGPAPSQLADDRLAPAAGETCPLLHRVRLARLEIGDHRHGRPSRQRHRLHHTLRSYCAVRHGGGALNHDGRVADWLLLLGICCRLVDVGLGGLRVRGRGVTVCWWGLLRGWLRWLAASYSWIHQRLVRRQRVL